MGKCWGHMLRRRVHIAVGRMACRGRSVGKSSLASSMAMTRIGIVSSVRGMRDPWLPLPRQRARMACGREIGMLLRAQIIFDEQKDRARQDQAKAEKRRRRARDDFMSMLRHKGRLTVASTFEEVKGSLSGRRVSRWSVRTPCPSSGRSGSLFWARSPTCKGLAWSRQY